LPQYKNSFGSTFKRWGWQHSSYLIVPFFGPGTVRDDLGLIPDVYFNPLFYFIQDPVISYSIFGLNLLDSRSKILGQDQIISQTLDPYATIRDLYLQKNGSYIYPTDNVNGPESSSADDSIDQLIDDQTVESAPRVNPARNSDSELDSILDEETTNRKLEASSPQSYRP
jgi:phospholipid-binding lipoprotein MlaA